MGLRRGIAVMTYLQQLLGPREGYRLEVDREGRALLLPPQGSSRRPRKEAFVWGWGRG